jgi:predicted dehydrogenase
MQMPIDLAVADRLRQAPAIQPVHLGIIGCGYVTAMSHLPALTLVDSVEVVALVDSRLGLAQGLAQQYGVPVATTNYEELCGQVDAVIVALPHQLHAAVATAFLNQGVHVLVEKPMALSTKECQQMAAAAQAANVQLAVGHMRRFYDSNLLVKRLLETQFFGEVQRFEVEEAVLFERFKASPFTLLPPAGGVLFDTGTHVLDQLLWWFGEFVQIEYWDDAAGGVEANCRIEVVTTNGAHGVIELSRIRHLKNEVRIFCEHGSIEVSTLNPSAVTLRSPWYSGPVLATTVTPETEMSALVPFFARQLTNFVGAIRQQEPLQVPAQEGMRNIALIEQCKQVRQPVVVPAWLRLNEQITQRVTA